LTELGIATILAVGFLASWNNVSWPKQGPDVDSDAFKISAAKAVSRWNGDIFWSPASLSSNVVTKFGDEARAVFGPIPDPDCSDGAAKILSTEVDGNIVDLKPNPSKPGGPLEFEHRDATGNLVKWTDSLPKCDKPSLAGEITYCGINSRVSRVVRGSVEWLSLCRKSRGSEVTTDPYWQASNPNFALLGILGFNAKTGEIVYFDGRKDRDSFDWSKPFIPPGGHSYSDVTGRATAEALYDPTFKVRCYACHDDKRAIVVDPRAEQSRVGYFEGAMGPRAAVFSLGDYLPEASRGRSAPFRVIGSGYTSKFRFELQSARVISDPTGNCTGCHTLTTQVTGWLFSADAVAQEPWITAPTWGQLARLQDEKTRYANVAAHRTEWALRSGAGKIHPWMLPGDGNKLDGLTPEMSPADWHQLSDCLWGVGGAECGYAPLYTACPAPESEPPGDSAGPTEVAATVLSLPTGEQGADRIFRLSWKYLNDFGGVPERDDVRFNVAVKETDIPSGGKPPGVSDYPTMEEAAGKNVQPIDHEIGVSGSATLIQNASYAGHLRWTDPEPATTPREYRIDLPATCNRRYLIRILPKRFCFDQIGVAYGSVDHLFYADVGCN
jgi:hypothetical protein